MVIPPEIADYFAWLRPIMMVCMPLIALGGLYAIGRAFLYYVMGWDDHPNDNS